MEDADPSRSHLRGRPPYGHRQRPGHLQGSRPGKNGKACRRAVPTSRAPLRSVVPHPSTILYNGDRFWYNLARGEAEECKLFPSPFPCREGLSMKTLTIREASDAVGRAPATIRRYIKSGRLPAEKEKGKFGEEFKIHHEALQALGIV